MHYLLNLYKEKMQIIVRYAEFYSDCNIISVKEKVLEKVNKLSFNNLADVQLELGIILVDKLSNLLANSQATIPKSVVTVLGTMKSARGMIIGYLVLLDDGKVNICSGEELVNGLDNNKIIITNATRESSMIYGLYGFKISNKIDEELSKEQISELYSKYKNGIQITRLED